MLTANKRHFCEYKQAKDILTLVLAAMVLAAGFLLLCMHGFNNTAYAGTESEPAAANISTDLNTPSPRRKMVIIGDSYASGMGIDPQWSWAYRLYRNMATPDSIVVAISGTGFCAVPEYTWFNMLREAYAQTSDPASVEFVVLCGGYNDWTSDMESIYSRAMSWISEAKNKFPNAQILLGHVGWNRNNSNVQSRLLDSTIPAYQKAARDSQIHYLAYGETFLQKNSWYFQADNFHPTETGGYYLERLIRQYLEYYQWNYENGNWYYKSFFGVAATGWNYIKNQWYYMDRNGIMQTGWQKIGGSWYYFDPVNGNLKTGWQLAGGKWYYLGETGAMQTGWLRQGIAWYYLDPVKGDMKVGWQYINGRWYYLQDSGAMLTGWQYIDGSLYYLDEVNGDMKNGWLHQDGQWYFLTSGGALAGTGLYLDKDGIYYYCTDGMWRQKYTGTIQYKGRTYYVTEGKVIV